MSSHRSILRRNQKYVLAFFCLSMVAFSVTTYVLVLHDHNVHKREMASGRDASSPYYYNRGDGKEMVYAQEDIGYGDGSTASASGGARLHPFPFDPNTADSTALLKLGLAPWQVRCIYRYRAHGGSYRMVEDFARLPGLTLENYNRLKPYIRIHKEVMAADVVGEGSAATDEERRQYNRDSHYDGSHNSGVHYEKLNKITRSDPKVDINTADTTLLKRIPGIGSYYARRIVEWRERYRHYLSVDELLAIRNFPESALAYMTTGSAPSPIHINSMTQQQLQAHAFLTYVQAKDIIRLRKTAGRIKSVEDMRFISSFKAEELERLAPYIVFD